MAKLRAALVQRVTEEDMTHIAEQLIAQAKLGNVAAIKLLFQYVLGKPAEPVNPDTLDIEEWRQCYQPLGQIMQEMPQAMATLPAQVACGMVAHIQPCRVHEFAAVLSLPQRQLEELREQAADALHYGELLREAACSPNQEEANGKKVEETARAPSTNGVGGMAATGKGAAREGEWARREESHRQQTDITAASEGMRKPATTAMSEKGVRNLFSSIRSSFVRSPLMTFPSRGSETMNRTIKSKCTAEQRAEGEAIRR